MTRRRALLLAAAIAWLGSLPARASPPDVPLTLVGTIRLDGVSGRIDHMAVDPVRQRLFVAELGNGTVDVVDLAAGKVLHRIDGLKEPQGVGYVPGADLIVVASAADGSVRMFSGTDFAPVGVIELGDDADNVRIDPRSGQVVVGYGGGGLAIIDPRTRAKLGAIALPAHPESFQLAPDGRTIFVNLPDAAQIAVVDRGLGRQVGRWKMPGLSANFPMAVVGDGGAIAIVFRSPARLVLFDPATGAPGVPTETCGDADDVFFDAKRQRLTVSCGQGAVDLFSWDGKAAAQLARIPTSSGARTSLFVPELDRLYVAARAAWFGDAASILVFQPTP